MELIELNSDGREIQGRIFRPIGEPTGGLLFIHGLHSDQSGYVVRAEAAVEALDVVCLTFDLSGHGMSPGVLNDLTPQDHLNDAIAAYAELARQLERPRVIGVCGASYGAFIAALLIAHRRVDRLLLRAPALVRDEDLNSPLGQRGPSSPAAAKTPLGNLSRFEGEILILESGQDEVIPHEFVEAYLAACHGRAFYEVIPGATHSLTEDRWQRQFIETIVRWFEPMVERSGSSQRRG
ncbi:MAG: alpha/beta hydrolase [Terriglobales bacterium]